MAIRNEGRQIYPDGATTGRNIGLAGDALRPFDPANAQSLLQRFQKLRILPEPYRKTVIRKNGVPPFSERVPFVVATVDLDEPGARVIAAMPGCAPDQAEIGMRVKATFRPASDEVAFVDFTPA